MKRGLLLMMVFLALALAKGAWPQNTQFVLLDSSGNVLWSYTEGQDLSQPTPGVLSQATTLQIILPDGTTAEVAVSVQGSGVGLGEVKLTVDGKLVPLPELLHAPSFALKDGQLVRVEGRKGASDEDGAQAGEGHNEAGKGHNGGSSNPSKGHSHRP